MHCLVVCLFFVTFNSFVVSSSTVRPGLVSAVLASVLCWLRARHLHQHALICMEVWAGYLNWEQNGSKSVFYNNFTKFVSCLPIIMMECLLVSKGTETWWPQSAWKWFFFFKKCLKVLFLFIIMYCWLLTLDLGFSTSKNVIWGLNDNTKLPRVLGCSILSYQQLRDPSEIDSVPLI